MGLLEGSQEEFIQYKDSKKHQAVLRENAALQLILLLKKFKNQTKCPKEMLKFGTEAETHLLKRVKKNGQELYSIDIGGKKFIDKGNEIYKDDLIIREEFPAWMIEIIPGLPFEQFLDFNEIYKHFEFSRKNLNQMTEEDSVLLMGMSTLPQLGTLNYYIPENNRVTPMKDRKIINKFSNSDYFLDETINNHSRFKSLTMNVKNRSGAKPNIRIPIYQDTNTKEKEVVLDHFGIGMSNIAMQVTYSCKDMDECRWVYDQMHVFGPLAQCLSNSTGVVNGKLMDWDSRWRLIEQGCDDRKDKERGKIMKSRYSPAHLYISNDPRNKNKYNDRPYTINKKFKKNLKRKFLKEGKEFYKDTRLLNHYAYLFVRECLTIFDSRKITNNTKNTYDFETIQSTNWNDVRFKPPGTFESKLGWLMEFRSMDSPITSKEKAALIFFFTLIQRIIVDEKLGVSFYVPISSVDKNFDVAISRNSITEGKFIFRKYFSKYLHGKDFQKDDVVEVTMAELLLGNSEFDGLKKLFEAFIEVNIKRLNDDSKKLGHCVIHRIWYVFNFYVARSKGEILSNSAFIKEFVMNHPDYKNDSNVSDKIATDLINKILKIQKDAYHPKLFGNHLVNF